MKDIIVKLPKGVEDLLSKDPFTIDGLIDDQVLNRYLFYMPEVVKTYGLIIASLKQKKREAERNIWKIENIELAGVRSTILLRADTKEYRNEELRDALFMSKVEYTNVLNKYSDAVKERDEIDGEIDTYQEEIWKFKNLMQSLDNISKLRVSERRY
jgi:hypothetical protein